VTRRPVDPQEPWRRLGALLVERREELGYRRTIAFVRAKGLKHRRVVDDLESGRRDNYSPSTLAQTEQLYGWKAGSIAAVLAGGEPQPAVTAALAGGDDQLRRMIRDVLALPISAPRKLEVIEDLTTREVTTR
jgi:hypothetical protein